MRPGFAFAVAPLRHEARSARLARRAPAASSTGRSYDQRLKRRFDAERLCDALAHLTERIEIAEQAAFDARAVVDEWSEFPRMVRAARGRIASVICRHKQSVSRA